MLYLDFLMFIQTTLSGVNALLRFIIRFIRQEVVLGGVFYSAQNPEWC